MKKKGQKNLFQFKFALLFFSITEQSYDGFYMAFA